MGDRESELAIRPNHILNRATGENWRLAWKALGSTSKGRAVGFTPRVFLYGVGEVMYCSGRGFLEGRIRREVIYLKRLRRRRIKRAD